MARIIKVKCNGPEQHVNEVDLDKILKPATVVRSARIKPLDASPSNIPERVVRLCKFCTQGRVIVTRDVIEANGGTRSA